MKSKYPFILVHGIMIKDYKFLKAFCRIEHVLREAGYPTFTSLTDAFGTIEYNAEVLKHQIEVIMKEYNVDKVNLIAHSKGGLDCKYMIQHLNMEDHVASLTTLCTPHLGSEIATNILKLPKPIIKLMEFSLNTTYKIFGDHKPDCLTVAKQLVKKQHIEDETIHFSNKVYCQSYSTTMDKSSDDFVMGIPLKFSVHFEKDTSDGLVSKHSTKFGHYKGDAIDDSISHTEIVDFMVKKSKKEKIYAFYLDLCDELTERGF